MKFYWEGTLSIDQNTVLFKCNVLKKEFNISFVDDVTIIDAELIVNRSFNLFVVCECNVTNYCIRCVSFDTTFAHFDISELEINLINPNLDWEPFNPKIVKKSVQDILDCERFGHHGISYSNPSEFGTVSPCDLRSSVTISASEIRCFMILNRKRIYQIWKDSESRETELSVCLIQFDYANRVQEIEIEQFVCGKAHSLILTKDNQVYSFGNGSRGELGHGNVTSLQEPTLIECLQGLRVIQISAGGWHSAAITAAGDLYVWGWNQCGQLGHRNEIGQTELDPFPVDCGDENILQVECGSRHTVFRTESKIYLMGDGNYSCILESDSKNNSSNKHRLQVLYEFVDANPKNIVASAWTTIVI